MTPQRIQRRRDAGWVKPSGAVYVGRPGIFGNPFAPDKIPGWATMSRENVVQDYRRWLFHLHGTTMRDGKIVCWCFDHGDRQAVLDALPRLRGKDLMCWCKLDAPCHADVLLELANQEPE